MAFARYLKLGDQWSVDWRDRWVESLAEGMDEGRIGEGFFEPMVRQHRASLGTRGHYCELVISPFFLS